MGVNPATMGDVTGLVKVKMPYVPIVGVRDEVSVQYGGWQSYRPK